MHCNLFLNALRFKKCVIKKLIKVFLFDSIPEQYKTQEMCNTVASNDPSLIVYCPDKYITPQMCDKAVD